jgi:hypothetical protein
MEGTIWLFVVLTILLFAVGVVVAGLHRRHLGADQTSRHCPQCETPMSLRRVSLSSLWDENK